MNKIVLTVFTVGFILSVYTLAAEESFPGFAHVAPKVVFDRATIFEQSMLPPLVALPVPQNAIALPKNWMERNETLSIRLSQQPPGTLLIRRVGNNNGILYLEIYCLEGKLSGNADVRIGRRTLQRTSLNGSLWLSLEPKIGKLTIDVLAAGEELQWTVPTTLVEVRGREIFLNGEPFLIKGATGSPANADVADYIRTLGFNTLRGGGAATDGEKYGFMAIASLNSINAPRELFSATVTTEDVFEQESPRYLGKIAEKSYAAIDNPYALILQLGNERSGGEGTPPGVQPVNPQRRRISQMLVAARNIIKPLCPMIPIGYANQDLSYLTPDCLDVYMHNSYYDKDRFQYPWELFLKWQGCLPPNGPTGQGRPFVNTEFGANRYIPQSYHGGPNNPVLEKLHAWNYPKLWSVFMQHGTVGGTLYKLDDHDAPIDQGCSRFGILTEDGKIKLACLEVGRMWRDFTVETRDNHLLITYKRDYYARRCLLTITPVHGKPIPIALGDFAPRSDRTILLRNVKLDDGYRWRMDFTTHSGLVNAAAGVYPVQLEEQEFLAQIQKRDTAPFLTELFDAEVLTVDGSPAPPTLFEMTDTQGIIPVVLHKPNGVTYLVPISREDPNASNGQIKEGVNLEIAFKGKVEKVDDMTGQPLPDVVDAVPTASGLRLTNIQGSRIPGPIGQRSDVPFVMPLYRITP